MPLLNMFDYFDVLFHCSQAFETVACMHVIANPVHHRSNKFIIDTIMKNTPNDLISRINKYSTITYDWTLLMDMISGIEPTENASFEDVIEIIKNLSDEEFSYFIFGGNKVSQEMLKEWIKNPDQVLDIDSSYFPVYVNQKEVHHYLLNAQEYKENIISIIVDFWETVFFKYWKKIEQILKSSIEQEKKFLKENGINNFLQKLNPNISFQDGKFIYSNIDVYPVYNFPFFKNFTSLRVFTSLFTAPHSYINHHHNFLVLSNNLKFNIDKNLEVQEDVIKGFKALSDQSRVKIMKIINLEPKTTKMLSDEINLSMGNISKHLKILKECDFVSTEKVKQEVFYSLNKENVYSLSTMIKEIFK